MAHDPKAPTADSLFYTAGVATWRWDAESDVLDLPEDGRRLLQVNREGPATVESLSESVHPDDAGMFRLAFKLMQEAPGTHQIEFRATVDDGSLRWFRAFAHPCIDEAGKCTHADGLLIDITDLRRAEAAYTSFFQQPTGLNMIAQPDGTIVNVNDVWEEITGYTPEELQGENLLDYVEADDYEKTIAQLGELSPGMNVPYFENWCLHKDGSYRLLAWSVAVSEGEGMIYCTARDITEEKEADLRLEQAAAVFNHSGQGIIVTDRNGVIEDVNDEFCRITGYEADEAIGQPTSILRSGHHGNEFYEGLWGSQERDGLWSGEIWNKRKDGDVYPQILTITRVSNADENEVRFIAIFTDISQIKKTEAELQNLAHYDPLTHLPNRYLINELLEQALRRAQRGGRPLAVAFIDIDYFKNVNDSLGHLAGDQLLRTTAHRLSDTLRETDNIGRLGGDEFLLVLEDIQSANDVVTIAEKLISVLRLPVELNGTPISVSASMGISLFPEDGSTAEALMSNADAAMYSAKEQGRDTFRFYSERLTEKAFQQVLLDSALREAQRKDQLQLVYQPQVDFDTREIIGLEALIRWQHPTLGAVPPANFIPHAERTGLIRTIGKWVLRNALSQGA